VTFLVQDIRETAPERLFHLILCRNLAFTYFDATLQRETMQRISDRLASGGALITGNLESIPDGSWKVQPWLTRLGVYRKALESQPD
jgi:chemotaxis protein methyltransferase CheR